MELTIEQIEIAKKIKELDMEIDLIHYELDDIKWTFYNENEREQARLLGLCDFLDSKAFRYRMELKALIWQLNNQGITEQSHPSIFPAKKIKPDSNHTNDDLLDDLPF